ncbi:MAG: hypothetical protein N3A59_06395 [Thermodesulfovibrionales bacterium]|nr:hypothetical protein [Thermodesulfovibrionales bacterium]
MKEEHYTYLICKRFCKFYKDTKDEIQCSGYTLLRDNLTEGELRDLSDYFLDKKVNYKKDKELYELLCMKCDFKNEGCDFIAGLQSPPCGGYIISYNLLRLFKF